MDKTELGHFPNHYRMEMCWRIRSFSLNNTFGKYPTKRERQPKDDASRKCLALTCPPGNSAMSNQWWILGGGSRLATWPSCSLPSGQWLFSAGMFALMSALSYGALPLLRPINPVVLSCAQRPRCQTLYQRQSDSQVLPHLAVLGTHTHQGWSQDMEPEIPLTHSCVCVFVFFFGGGGVHCGLGNHRIIKTGTWERHSQKMMHPTNAWL